MTPALSPQQIIDRLPPEAWPRLKQIIPATCHDMVLDSFRHKELLAFRLNPLRFADSQTCAEPLIEDLRQRVPSLAPLAGFAHTWLIPAAEKLQISTSPAARDGLVYFQNPSSMLAVQALELCPQLEVLDLAAAPGGKTSLMATYMQNTGRIAAVEPNRNRFFRLQANLQQLGVSNTRLYMHDGRDIGRKTPGRFDRVLLDAPCSSDSVFNIEDAESLAHWNLKKVKTTARTQQKLIQSAFDALKPGGILVYSTCAFSPEENEQVIDRLLRQNPEACLAPWQPAPDILHGSLAGNIFQPALAEWAGRPLEAAGSLRILPNTLYNGFYLAKILKTI